MPDYLKPLVQLFEENQNPDLAGPMTRYMRNQFAFLGIQTPLRRALFKKFLSDNGLPDFERLPEVMAALWAFPQREYQQAGLDLLGKLGKNLDAEHVPMLKRLIVTHAEKWIADRNIWLNRTALLFQLKYKTDTDEDRLFRYIMIHAHSDEFFLQKAISWALREYSKTAPETVKQFIRSHKLMPLSRREGLKWINRYQ
ncbi:DNA alkylation repair protein [Sporolactobacillus pectinivorans]|uniref:DNA alkylation repair protein n=1 Tax=Sporolactobacillus pectinivorans TaxID=1591408 RepID=UPI000C262426|nr:DNA alkylation repair protein [Sporolactobacillus pectinivorans]